MADQYIQVPNDFQSPLHRGILCNHLRRASVTGAAEPFQSPLHRGILCNGAAAHGGHGHIHAFSPLFIGEYSATMPPPTADTVTFTLSVPSSSGNTLQRPSKPVHPRAKVSFSPLFIGEYSATIKQHLVFSYARIFQSPLHRGILCNLIVVVKKQTGESFSPL